MAVSMAFPVLITRCVRIFWIFSLLQRDLMRWISLQSLSSSSMSCTSFINLYCVPLPEVFSYDHYEIFHRIVAIPLCIPSRREFAKRIFESENEKITSFQHESLIHSRHFRLKFDCFFMPSDHGDYKWKLVGNRNRSDRSPSSQFFPQRLQGSWRSNGNRALV